MILPTAFLKSKVGKRISFLFVLCALVPVLSLAVLSYQQVTKELARQGRARIHQACKSQAMALFERLLIIESELRSLGIRLEAQDGQKYEPSSSLLTSGLEAKFRAVHLLTREGTPQLIWGRSDIDPFLSESERSRISGERPSLFLRRTSTSIPRIFMALRPEARPDSRGLLIAEIEPRYLWYMGYEDALPSNSDLLVLSSDKKLLYSSIPAFPSELKKMQSSFRVESHGFIEWNPVGKPHLAAHRALFLGGRFDSPVWSIVLSEPSSDISRPVAAFARTFPLVSLLSLWVVVFLSFSQIRRSLVPLEKLKLGADRISRKDFESRVVVESGDEFEDVAKSFNAMSRELGKQFKYLELIAEIDRGVLSTMDSEKIVDILFSHISGIHSCRTVGMTLIDSQGSGTARTYVKKDGQTGASSGREVEISPQEAARLFRAADFMLVESPPGLSSCLRPLEENGSSIFHVFPIVLQDELAAVVSLGYARDPEFSREDIVQIRRLFDRVGIAFSNMRLIRELKQFNQGTLVSLARTIDAKSPWTAGHSERVTRIAMEIGRYMHLPEKDLEILQKGGLLHDIGKLGIPNAILNKKGKLTREETRIMRKHSELGAGILEPIGAYSAVMRIVREHHENFDGTGYPDGLAGDQISLFSRIFAVADNFDALTSDRPYRRAISLRAAVESIRRQAGSKFDPEVVNAFLAVQASRPESNGEQTGKNNSEETRP